MKFIISPLFIVIFLTSCCQKITYTTIENKTQRQYEIECLRVNNIDFALKDDGTILILGEEANKKYKKLKDIFYDASVRNDLKICNPNNISEK